MVPEHVREFFFSAPQAEKENGFIAQTHLNSLGEHISAIEYALMLFDSSEMQMNEAIATDKPWQMYLHWMNFAAREIAITVDDYYRSLTAARAMLERCKTIWPRFNYACYDSAHTEYIAIYPQHLDLRNAACHKVDYSAKPHNVRDNAAQGAFQIKGNGGGTFTSTDEDGAVMITGCIVGRTIVYSGNGVLLKLDLTTKIVENLLRVAGLVFLGFPSSARHPQCNTFAEY